MKAAEANSVWRAVFARKFSVAYLEVGFKGVHRLGVGAMQFAPGITAVIGGNGVGKSTLMSTVLQSLAPLSNPRLVKQFGSTAGTELYGQVSIDSGASSITLRCKGDERVLEPAGTEAPGHRWIDPSTLATDVREVLLKDADVATGLEGIDPEKFEAAEIADLSYVVGREYQVIEVFEIEGYGGMEVFPYFNVTVDGVKYGSAEMGLGELSLFLIYWTLRSLAPKTLVFVEEPETHVSPRSQERLMDVVAKFCVRKDLSLVVTTHSPFIVSRLRRKNLQLVIREGMKAAVIPEPSPDQVARVLGDRLSYHGAILVEDDMGRAILRAILRQNAPDLVEYFEIAVAEGDSGIAKALDALPELRQWFSLVGVFDGDQVEARKEKKHVWPHLFLPGQNSPHDILKTVVETKKDAVVAALRCSPGDMVAACDAAQGQDGHDWLRTIRQSLQLEIPQFVDALIHVWLEEVDNKKMAESLVDGIRKYTYVGLWAADQAVAAK